MPQLDPQVLDALRSQHSTEHTNALAYDALATSLENEAWIGFAEFMRKSAAEEREHAARIANYTKDRGEWIGTPSPSRPADIPNDPAGCVSAAMQLEEFTTGTLIALHVLAWNKVDLQTTTFLNWFLDEQTHSTGVLMDIATWLEDADRLTLLTLDERVKGMNP